MLKILTVYDHGSERGGASLAIAYSCTARERASARCFIREWPCASASTKEAANELISAIVCAATDAWERAMAHGYESRSECRWISI